MLKIVAVTRMLSSSRYLVRRLQTRYVLEQTQGKIFPVIIDVGAGSAPYKKIIAHERYIAVDTENRMGDADEIVFGDLTKGLPFDDNMADLVLCTEVLEHLPDHGIAMRELYRVLKPGGTLIITVPFVWVLHEAPNDFYRFTNFGLHHMLHSVGFLKVEVTSSNNYLYTFLQLMLIPLRHPIFIPIVIFVNMIGYVVGKHEASFLLPLNQHARAEK